MTRIVAAVVLALHGLIHLIGFVVPWQIATVEGFAYRTTAFGGGLVLGDTGVRIVGLAWLALVLGFAGAGYGVWRDRSWAPAAAWGAACASLVVCVIGLPETAAGVAIDLGMIAAIPVVVVRQGTRRTRPATSPPSTRNASPHPHHQG